MGTCFYFIFPCCKKKNNYNLDNNRLLNENIQNIYNEEPAETADSIKIDVNFDVEKAKNLVKVLLNSDLGFFQNQLDEVLGLSPEEFKILFKGNSDYDYNVSNKKDFKRLAAKFENFSLLLNEWYKKGQNYYECLKDVWNGFIALCDLNNLNDNDLDKQLNSICKCKYWTEGIKEEFKRVIRATEDISDKLKNFLNVKFKELDEIIKSLSNSKKYLEKTEKENKEKKNIALHENIKSIINKLLESSIPLYIDKINDDLEENNITEDKITNLSSEEKKNLIKTVALKYIRGAHGDFNPKEEFENIKNISNKFNLLKLFSKESKDQLKLIANNKFTAHGILGLSFLNLCCNIFYTYDFFKKSDVEVKRYQERLDIIKKDFDKHKNDIPGIDFDNYEEAKEKIVDIRMKFEEDKMAVDKLIKEIEDEIQQQNLERRQSIYNIIISGTSFVASVAGGVVTKEKSSKSEYAFSGIFSGISAASGIANLVKIADNIKKYKNLLNEAKMIQKQIIEKIEEISQQFRELQEHGLIPKFHNEY